LGAAGEVGLGAAGEVGLALLTHFLCSLRSRRYSSLTMTKRNSTGSSKSIVSEHIASVSLTPKKAAPPPPSAAKGCSGKKKSKQQQQARAQMTEDLVTDTDADLPSPPSSLCRHSMYVPRAKRAQKKGLSAKQRRNVPTETWTRKQAPRERERPSPTTPAAGGFGGSPPDSPKFCPLLLQKSSCNSGAASYQSRRV
jgi:hypothetical protein